MPEPVSGIGAASALTELFGLTGKLPLQLEKFVMPIAIIGDVGDEVAWGSLCYGSHYMAAVVAPNVNRIELSLPVQATTQGLKARIESINVRQGGTAGYLYIYPSGGLAAPTGAGESSWADTRKRGLPQLQINSKNDAAGAGGPQPISMLFGIGANTPVPLDWILGQNPDTGVQQGLMIECGNPLTSLYLNIRWREGAAR